MNTIFGGLSIDARCHVLPQLKITPSLGFVLTPMAAPEKSMRGIASAVQNQDPSSFELGKVRGMNTTKYIICEKQRMNNKMNHLRQTLRLFDLVHEETLAYAITTNK